MHGTHQVIATLALSPPPYGTYSSCVSTSGLLASWPSTPPTHLRLKAPSTRSAPLYSHADTPAGPPEAATGGASSSSSGTLPSGGRCAVLTEPPVSNVVQPLSARANRAFIQGVRDSGSCSGGARAGGAGAGGAGAGGGVHDEVEVRRAVFCSACTCHADSSAALLKGP